MAPTGEILEHQPEQMSPGAAAHVIAMRAAEGAGVSQSWIAALDHLQHSAELGFRPAQAELAALAGEWNLSQQIEAGQEQPSQPGTSPLDEGLRQLERTFGAEEGGQS